jgi:hypothetical protein
VGHPRLRLVIAIVIAVVVHGVVAVVMAGLPVRVWPRQPSSTVEFRVVAPPAPSPKPEEPTPPSATPTPTPPTKNTPKTATSPTLPTSTPEPAGAVVEPTVVAPAVPAVEPPSFLRTTPGVAGTMAEVLGVGMPSFGPSAATLERSLDLGVSGPRSDAQRASERALDNLQDDISDDAVTAGLADDYFRLLRLQIERTWRPAKNELNDGGASASQVGLSKAFVTDMSAWQELWTAYLDVAKQYANGVQPQLAPKRRERLMELMRSRKGMFRIQAIGEFLLTQSSDGKVQLLETKIGTGHPRIDDGMTAAIAAAVTAMPDAPPDRMTHGRSFSSTWRLRATWQMVPPTAFFSGAGFDITSKGLEVDVPFDIKLITNVMLVRTDARITPP